jgi:outer membrane protein assembly factor BamB
MRTKSQRFKSEAIHGQMQSLLFLLGLFWTTVTYAGDQGSFWPQFHGPNRDNLSTETGLLKKWPLHGPALLWTARGLGHGYSSISIANQMIYTAGDIGQYTVITALNLDGTIVWQGKNGQPWTGAYPGSRGTPAIDGNRLFHQNPLGNLICLDATTGDRIWEFNILEKFHSTVPRWALAESLLVDREHLISCPGGPQTCMVALDKTDGTVAWQAPSIGEVAGYASPALFEYKGLRIITTLTCKSLIGVNADTGELLWRQKHETYYDENIMTPIVHDGEVFVSTLVGSVKWRVHVKDGKASLAEIWRAPQLDNGHSGVILVNEELHGSGVVRSRVLVCLDWKTGRVHYMDKCVAVALAYADGMLHALSEDGVMGLVQPTPIGHKLVSHFQDPKRRTRQKLGSSRRLRRQTLYTARRVPICIPLKVKAGRLPVYVSAERPCKICERRPAMKQRRYATYWILTLALWGSSAVFAEPFAQGPYLGQTPPGPGAQVFAPGLICDPGPLQGEAWVSFSADGNILCFNRLGYVYITENTDRGWTAPERIESIPYGTTSCCLSPDANSIHFNYSYDPSKRYSHHRCTRTSQGWSWPEELGPPFDSWTGGFSVAADNSIYFVAGRGHFRVAPFVDNTWAPAVSIPVDVEGSLKSCNPGIAPDASFMVFYSIRPGAPGGTETDLYLTLRRPNGTWTKPRNLGPRINSRYYEHGARISPDKKHLFFNRSNGWDRRNYTGDIYWVELKEYLPESYR